MKFSVFKELVLGLALLKLYYALLRYSRCLVLHVYCTDFHLNGYYVLYNADNPCDGIPCKNLGTCTKEASGYRCSCYLGFDDKTDCEIGNKCFTLDQIYFATL